MQLPHPTILSFGEVLWDVFPEGPRFGGAPANFACHASLLGARVSLLSAVGTDNMGDEALRCLASAGVNTSLVQRCPTAATGTVQVALDASGIPSYKIQQNAAWDQIQITKEAISALQATSAVYFGTLGQRSNVSRCSLLELLALATEKRLMRVLDVNLRAPHYDHQLIRESIAAATVLKLSDEELPTIAAACGIASSSPLHALRDSFDLDHVVMTCGAEGAVLVSKYETIREPGMPTEVVDTVGAGDSFTAALVVGLLRGQPLAAIARHACHTAAHVCSYAGAVPTNANLSSQPCLTL